MKCFIIDSSLKYIMQKRLSFSLSPSVQMVSKGHSTFGLRVQQSWLILKRGPEATVHWESVNKQPGSLTVPLPNPPIHPNSVAACLPALLPSVAEAATVPGAPLFSRTLILPLSTFFSALSTSLSLLLYFHWRLNMPQYLLFKTKLEQ